MAKTLRDASEAELLAELERKKKTREAGERPRPLKSLQVQKLIDICDAHIESMETGEYHDDDDSKHYIYEEAMKTVFGPKIFEWMNKKR